MRNGLARRILAKEKSGPNLSRGTRPEERISGAVTLCKCLIGSVFSRNYTVPGHPRSPSSRLGRRAANLFSPSLEISDDVHGSPPPPSPLSSGGMVPAASQGRFIKKRASLTHLSRYIFKIAYNPPPPVRVRTRRMESHAATKICRCAKNRK